MDWLIKTNLAQEKAMILPLKQPDRAQSAPWQTSDMNTKLLNNLINIVKANNPAPCLLTTLICLMAHAIKSSHLVNQAQQLMDLQRFMPLLSVSKSIFK